MVWEWGRPEEWVQCLPHREAWLPAVMAVLVACLALQEAWGQVESAGLVALLASAFLVVVLVQGVAVHRAGLALLAAAVVVRDQVLARVVLVDLVGVQDLAADVLEVVAAAKVLL